MSSFLAAVKATHKPPMPHQQAAWNFAWDQLNEKQKAEFLVLFRSDPPQKAALIGKVLLNVKYEYQLDNASGSGYRECFSSSCAMVANFWGKVENDDSYNRIRERYGDTTNSSAQISTLRSLGLDARLVTNASAGVLEAELKAGRPVPVGWLHKGNNWNPSGGGHWSVAIGFDDTHWILHDPNGEADLINGGYANHNNGKAIRYSKVNFNRRWCVSGTSDGWAILCKPLDPHG
jgi:hypothetical protein